MIFSLPAEVAHGTETELIVSVRPVLGSVTHPVLVNISFVLRKSRCDEVFFRTLISYVQARTVS